MRKSVLKEKSSKAVLDTQHLETFIPAQTREELVATALKNMQQTRDIIGEEKLQKLAQLILQKKNVVDDTSPAIQAKKIIAQMDKDKLRHFMKMMVHDDQTKH